MNETNKKAVDLAAAKVEKGYADIEGVVVTEGYGGVTIVDLGESALYNTVQPTKITLTHKQLAEICKVSKFIERSKEAKTANTYAAWAAEAMLEEDSVELF